MRKNTIQKTRVLAGCICAAIAIMIAETSVPATAQLAVAPKTADLLKKTVAFEAAPRSVAEITRSLSAQTGLTIEAENCLLERTVVIQSERASAFHVLNALAELHDWQWEETEEHKIVIKRPIVRPATSLKEVPLAIKAALPKDLRNYLGFGVPTDSLPPPTEPGQQQVLKSRQTLGPGVVGNKAVQFRITEKARHVKQALMDQLPPDVRSGARRKWSQLEKPLQSALLLAMVVGGLQDAYRSGGGEAILAQRLYPFQVDPTRIELKFKGSELLIGSTTYNLNEKTRSFDGFGGTVDQ